MSHLRQVLTEGRLKCSDLKQWDRGNMDALTDYLAHLQRRGLRPSYINNQRLTLRRLARHTGLLEATRDTLTDYLDHRPQSAASRRVEIAHLCGFYSWAVEYELIAFDPTRRLVRPRSRRMLPKPMPDGELASAFLDPPPTVAAILSLAYYAGLRACEIAQLRGEDITDVITIQEGKGGGMSCVPLAPQLADILEMLPLPKKGWMFPRMDGKPGHLSRSRVGQLANVYLRDLGLTYRLHSLRHRFGTEVYRASKDLRLTQELMRHQSPVTTAGYTFIDPRAGWAVLAAIGVNAAA